MKNSEEYLSIVDENNRPIGKAAREEAHRKGLWHRCANVWVYNDKGEILLQKRSGRKDTFPGLWDLSVAGHACYGDSYLKTAYKELAEELGIVHPAKLKPLFTVKAIHKPGRFVDREFQRVYLLKLDRELRDFKPNRNEISELGFFNAAKLKAMISDKEKRKLFVPSYGYWLKVIEKIERKML